MKVIIGHKKNWEFIRYDFEAEEQEDVATMEEVKCDSSIASTVAT